MVALCQFNLTRLRGDTVFEILRTHAEALHVSTRTVESHVGTYSTRCTPRPERTPSQWQSGQASSNRKTVVGQF